jgi:hypothetical protein
LNFENGPSLSEDCSVEKQIGSLAGDVSGSAIKISESNIFLSLMVMVYLCKVSKGTHSKKFSNILLAMIITGL